MNAPITARTTVLYAACQCEDRDHDDHYEDDNDLPGMWEPADFK